ncbi:MAG: phosphate-starvation-inducible protein PsiE [Magnetospiraceae bacterium]
MKRLIGRGREINKKMQIYADDIGNLLVDGFHLMALFAIGAAVVYAAVLAFLKMILSGHGTVEDILLLFIYLELGAMVGIYFKTNHMPVRFLIYIAITALTRLMIGGINAQHERHEIGEATVTADIHTLILSGAILILAIAVLLLRYGSNKFPSTHLINKRTQFGEDDS